MWEGAEGDFSWTRPALLREFCGCLAEVTVVSSDKNTHFPCEDLGEICPRKAFSGQFFGHPRPIWAKFSVMRSNFRNAQIRGGMQKICPNRF